MCDQQSLRSACAYAQSDQSLCFLHEYSMSVELLTEHHLEFLSLKEAAQACLSLNICYESYVTAQNLNCVLFAQNVYIF